MGPGTRAQQSRLPDPGGWPVARGTCARLPCLASAWTPSRSGACATRMAWSSVHGNALHSQQRDLGNRSRDASDPSRQRHRCAGSDNGDGRPARPHRSPRRGRDHPRRRTALSSGRRYARGAARHRRSSRFRDCSHRSHGRCPKPQSWGSHGALARCWGNGGGQRNASGGGHRSRARQWRASRRVAHRRAALPFRRNGAFYDLAPRFGRGIRGTVRGCGGGHYHP